MDKEKALELLKYLEDMYYKGIKNMRDLMAVSISPQPQEECKHEWNEWNQCIKCDIGFEETPAPRDTRELVDRVLEVNSKVNEIDIKDIRVTPTKEEKCNCQCMWCLQGKEDMCGLDHLIKKPPSKPSVWEEELVGFGISGSSLKDWIRDNFISRSELKSWVEENKEKMNQDIVLLYDLLEFLKR